MFTPSLEQKVAFLSRAGSYPERPDHVRGVETHMSWLFLTRDHVWKLKKPVRHHQLDFSTLEKRALFCRQEVELNRRLAGFVYLGALPLRQEAQGRLSLEGNGEVVDWLVKMRRLAKHDCLVQRLESGAASDRDAAAIGARLAAFFRQAERKPLSLEAYIRLLKERADYNFSVLSEPPYRLPAAMLREIRHLQRLFMQEWPSLLRGRLSRLSDGHGDLRPEHVFLLPEPFIIDCIEFSAELRLNDPAYEVAYLRMECARMGHKRFGDMIFSTYCQDSGDKPDEALNLFYAAAEAVTRARLSVLHLADFAGNWPAQWINQANEYLRMALSYSRLSIERKEAYARQAEDAL